MLVLLVPREVFRLAEVPIVISCNDFGWDRRESLRDLLRETDCVSRGWF